MAGGAPAGMSIRPGEFGCLTKRMRIRITTMRGNSITTPSGMEMVEFPLRRSGLRKKSKRDHNRPDLVLGLCSFSSAVGSGGGPVRALPARRIRSMTDGVDAKSKNSISWWVDGESSAYKALADVDYKICLVAGDFDRARCRTRIVLPIEKPS